MRYLKKFNESSDEEIREFLEKYMYMNKYTINNGLVDVEGDVYLSHKRLESIPIKFGHVSGIFQCNHNRLSTPETIGHFNCSKNKLTTLYGLSENIKELLCDFNPIAKYWSQVNDMDKLEIFLFSDIDTNDGDKLCQQKVDFILKDM